MAPNRRGKNKQRPQKKRQNSSIQEEIDLGHKERKAIRMEEKIGVSPQLKFGGGGGTDHHCGECGTPMSNPKAVSKCIGIHMFACESYHATLFRHFKENACDSCRAHEEAKYTRHVEIARFLHKLKSLDPPPKSSKTRQPAVNRSKSPKKNPRKLTKSERKRAAAARKAAAIAEQSEYHPTADEIERVKDVLQPENCHSISSFDGGNDDDTLSMVGSPSVHLRSGKGKPKQLSDAAVTEIVRKLGVDAHVKKPSASRATVMNKLVAAIQDYRIWFETERDGTVHRRFLFFKYAGVAGFERNRSAIEANKQKRAEWNGVNAQEAQGKASSAINSKDDEQVAADSDDWQWVSEPSGQVDDDGDSIMEG